MFQLFINKDLSYINIDGIANCNRDTKTWWVPMPTLPMYVLQPTVEQSSSQSTTYTGESMVHLPPNLQPLFKEVRIKLEPLEDGEVRSVGHLPVHIIVGTMGVGASGSVGAEPQL